MASSTPFSPPPVPIAGTPVVVIPQDLDPRYPNPPGIQEALNSVAQNTTYEIDADSSIIVVGPNNPAVEDQSKVWLQTTACGAPIGWFRWSDCAEKWVPVILGLPGEIRMFCGDPTLYFDSTGLGLSTGEWYGWALCNGANGTPGLQDNFIVSGAPAGGRFLAYFDAKNSGVTSGGSTHLTIALENIPAVSALLPFIGGFTTGGSQYALPVGGGADQYNYTMAARGTGDNLELEILPPFVAQGYVMWVQGPCGPYGS